MIVFITALIGAIFGGSIAKKRGGNKLDIAQYVGGFAIAFGLVGLIITLFVHRVAL